MAGGAFFVGVVGGGGEALDELALLVVEFVPGAEAFGVAAGAGVLSWSGHSVMGISTFWTDASRVLI
jgi:hypothetical protein